MNQYPAGLAALTASPYADSDVMNVRMTPREVAGLQQLAMSYGANERDLYDPITGQPRFSFLKKILPMIAGAVLPSFKPFAQFAETVGFGSQALGTALIVGGATGLIEGDLKKGLMAGLGAYSGAKIGEGLSASASKVGGAAPPPATESTVGTPAKIEVSRPRFTEEGGIIPQTQAAPVPAPVQPVQPVTTVTPPPSTGFFGTMGQGISGLMKPEGRTAFMEALGGPISKSAVFMGAVDALTPTPKPFPTGGAAGEDIVYIPGGFNPQYGTGKDQPYQLPGKYYKRTPQGLVPYNPFQLAPPGRGFAAGGAVQLLDENMNPRWSFPHKTAPYPFPNQNYPLSNIMQANYQSNSPQPREVVGGYEVAIDPYNGEERFAEGGMVPGGPETFTPITISPYAAPTTDPNVLATRAYIEELNRRARFPFGMQGAGGMGGGTGTGVLGGGYPFIPGTGGAGTGGGGSAGAGSGLGALAASVAGSYLLNKGIGAGVDYLRDKYFPGKSEEQQPTQQQQQAVADQRFAQDFALDPTIAALTLPTFIKPQTPLPPTRTTVEPVSYEGEKMVVREDPTVTQQPRPATTSSVPYTTGALAGLNAISPFMNISPLPPTRTTIEPVSYEGEEMVLREDPTVTQQPRPAATSSVPYTTGTLAGLNVFSPFANLSRLPATSTTVTPISYEGEDIVINDDVAQKLDADLQAKTRVGGAARPLSSYLSGASALGSGLSGLAGLGRVASVGIELPIYDALGNLVGFSAAPGAAAAATGAAGAAGAAGTSGAAAAGTEAAKAGTEAAKAGLGKSAILPGLQTALGVYETFKGIQSGSESRAALGGFGLGAGLAGLGGAGVSSLGGLAALGATPVGLAAAAIAAIGASLVNTKEFGDVALRNYWNAVDAGRGIGQTDPVELAQGFINFYRTNKNEFAGQQAYGRTGNEQFLYDMTQVINDAVKSGKVDKNIDAGAMYRQVVQPWLNSLGSGPQNEDAKRIQDFMMTDLINSFMQGKPISNAQVKGDTKYDIVSKNPVYGGDAPTPPPLSIPRTESIDEIVRQAESFAPPNPFAAREDRVSPIREMREAERESIMPVAATTPIMEEPVYGGRESIMPPPDFSGIDAGLIPEAPPPDPMRGVSLGDAREGIMPVDTTVPITEEPPPAPPILPEPVNPYAEQEARRVEQERFAREQEAFRQAEVDRQEMARQAAYQRQMEYEAQQRFEAQRQAEMQRQYEMQQAAARAEAERQAQIQRQYEMQQAAARAEAIRQAEIEAARRAEEDRARFYIPREEAVPIEPYYAAVQPESVPIEPYYAAVQPESVPIEQYYAPVEAYNPYAEERFSYRPEFGEYAFAAGGAIGEDYNFGFARGGTPEYLAGGKLLKGPGDGMSDSIPAVIRGKGVQRAALADGEFVIPADVVSHLGNGSTNAGAKKLYAMMNKIRQARTGRTRQAPAVKTDRYLPA